MEPEPGPGPPQSVCFVDAGSGFRSLHLVCFDLKSSDRIHFVSSSQKDQDTLPDLQQNLFRSSKTRSTRPVLTGTGPTNPFPKTICSPTRTGPRTKTLGLIKQSLTETFIQILTGRFMEFRTISFCLDWFRGDRSTRPRWSRLVRFSVRPGDGGKSWRTTWRPCSRPRPERSCTASWKPWLLTGS